MITFGTIYIITQDFEGTLEFYKKLFERDVAAQNKTRFACFQIDGLGLSVMNGKFDAAYPEEVVRKGDEYALYDDMEQIAYNPNGGKVVINLCTDDLKKEYHRIKTLGIGTDLTDIRYINAGMPYWYFCLKDLDGNTIEITGNYAEGQYKMKNRLSENTKQENIHPVYKNDLKECVEVIRSSFKTVADELGFTEKEAPRFTAFATTLERLLYHYEQEKKPMFAYWKDERIVGYYSLLKQNGRECELNNLCVLKEYRHNNIGKELLEHAFSEAEKMGCCQVNIGIVEENVKLRDWYEENGAKHVRTEKYEFFPFTCGYMRKEL